MGAELPAGLASVRERWRVAERREQDRLYAAEFVDDFLPLFAALPLEGAPEEMRRPRALVSVLGLSWQPVALMGAWARPEVMLVLGTRESLQSEVLGEPVLEFVRKQVGLSPANFVHVQVPDPPEVEIYREIRDFLRQRRIEPQDLFVDPTGGKKSMSAAAALAAFWMGARLVYVDYREYHPQSRIPVPGSEYPRLMANPLNDLGDLEIERIVTAYRVGRYAEAASRSEDLARRLYEPRLAESYRLAALAYGAWDAFRFKSALEHLQLLWDHVERHAERGRWSFTPELRRCMSRNLPTLRALGALEDAGGMDEKPGTLETGLPLVLNHYAAAVRTREIGKTSLAVLFLYATVERFVDLCLWVGYGLDDERPQFEKLGQRLDMKKYHELGSRLFKDKYIERPLEGSINYSNGLQLLAVLEPGRITAEEFFRLQGLGTMRNKSEFEHGLLAKPVPERQVDQAFDQVRGILARAVGGTSELENRLADFLFPRL